MNPDLIKNSDKCFFSILKNRAGVLLHTANCNGFFSVFMVVSSLGEIQETHGWLFAIRRLSDPTKINNFDEPFCNFSLLNVL
jgi:hypothetical protein